MRWSPPPDTPSAQADGGKADNLRFPYIAFIAWTSANNPLSPGKIPCRQGSHPRDQGAKVQEAQHRLFSSDFLQQTPSLVQQILPKASECDYFCKKYPQTTLQPRILYYIVYNRDYTGSIYLCMIVIYIYIFKIHGLQSQHSHRTVFELLGHS